VKLDRPLQTDPESSHSNQTLSSAYFYAEPSSRKENRKAFYTLNLYRFEKIMRISLLISSGNNQQNFG